MMFFRLDDETKELLDEIELENTVEVADLTTADGRQQMIDLLVSTTDKKILKTAVEHIHQDESDLSHKQTIFLEIVNKKQIDAVKLFLQHFDNIANEARNRFGKTALQSMILASSMKSELGGENPAESEDIKKIADIAWVLFHEGNANEEQLNCSEKPLLDALLKQSDFYTENTDNADVSESNGCCFC